MTSVVRPSISRSKASCIKASFSASTLDSASSSTRTGAFFSRALAMAIRCFCPPDSLTARSPTRVSYPLGSSEMNR